MKATRRALIGRRIVDVDFYPFSDGRGGTAHDPYVTLDNGRRLYFVTEETENGEYGTKICISLRERRPARRPKPILIRRSGQ